MEPHMGYDITFHPIKAEEITYFIFDVIGDPTLMQSRIDLLSQDEDQKNFLSACYNHTLAQFLEKKSQHVSSLALSFFCGTISSFLHPYWYVRNDYLSKFIESGVLKNDIFSSFREYMTGTPLKKLRDGTLLIEENYAGSGYVTAEKARTIYQSVLSQLLKAQEELLLNKKQFEKLHAPSFFDKIQFQFRGGTVKTIDFPEQDNLTYLEELIEKDSDFLWALKSLEEYCIANNTGFIEAADLVVPIMGDFRTNPENMKDRFSGCWNLGSVDKILTKP